MTEPSSSTAPLPDTSTSSSTISGIPGLSTLPSSLQPLPSTTTTTTSTHQDPQQQSQSQSPTTPRTINLSPSEELRLELSPTSHHLTITLLSGHAEIFGTELPLSQPIIFPSPSQFAIFTYQGCVLQLLGSVNVEYKSNTGAVMSCYLNTHLALDNIRKGRISLHPPSYTDPGNYVHKIGNGPRVMILGSEGSGKSSLCKTLLNYGVKSGGKILYVDVDSTEGTLTIPGSIASTPISQPLPLPHSFAGSSLDVISYYFGYPSIISKPYFYLRTCESLSKVVLTKLCNEDNNFADPVTSMKQSGFIMNTPSEFIEKGVGEEVLRKVLEMFLVNVVVVIDNERLYADLKKRYEGLNVTVLSLPKSGGAVSRDKSLRKILTAQEIRAYFYGHSIKGVDISDYNMNTQMNAVMELHPYREILRFDDIVIKRVEENIAPLASALPLGSGDNTNNDNKDNQLIKPTPINYIDVVPGDILLYSVLAVSHATGPNINKSSMDSESVSKELLSTNIAGFVHVSDVDMVKRKLVVLSPNPIRVGKRVLIMGALKWSET